MFSKKIIFYDRGNFLILFLISINFSTLDLQRFKKFRNILIIN